MRDRLVRPARIFSRLVARDARMLRDGLREHDLKEVDHLRAASEWLLRAQVAAGDGISYGYSLRGGWLAPYRETSGYIIPTLYHLARELSDDHFAGRATATATWLLAVQNADGSFANPKYGPRGIVFDTGQCIFGLLAAFQHTGQAPFLRAAERAGDWLVSVVGTDRHWRASEHMATPHTYNSRTAWALLELDRVSPRPNLVDAAVRNLEWALTNQRGTGLFDHNSFARNRAPYTHNISYALCGLQESGWILQDDRYVAAARRCGDVLIEVMAADGRLPGQISVAGATIDWYSCLTGQAQLAVAWGRQYQHGAGSAYHEAAKRSLRFVKSVHYYDAPDPEVRGGVAGSFPIWGRYAPFSYTNWACKFFIDALLWERTDG